MARYEVPEWFERFCEVGDVVLAVVFLVLFVVLVLNLLTVA